MKRPIAFTAAAETEADEAIEWYEEREVGLGTRFREALEGIIVSIQTNPFAYPVVEGSAIRRAVVNGFPYIVVYSLEVETILILSVFHTSRNPIIWRGRID